MPSLLFVRLHNAWELSQALLISFQALRYAIPPLIGLAMLEAKAPASLGFWTRIIAYSFYPEGVHSELLERSHPWLLGVLFCTC